MLIATNGSVSAIVVMHAINVFLTFSLSEMGMVRFFCRPNDPNWKGHISIHLLGLVPCVTILFVTVFEKFGEGGWIRLLITAAPVALCYLIRAHYRKIKSGVRRLEEDMASIFQNFPNVYKNFIFVSVAEFDSSAFRHIQQIDSLKGSISEDLSRYVALSRRHGYPGGYRMDIGTDVAEKASPLCESLVKEFPHSMIFTGKLVFRQEICSRRSSATRRHTPSSGGFSGRESRRSSCRSAARCKDGKWMRGDFEKVFCYNRAVFHEIAWNSCRDAKKAFRHSAQDLRKKGGRDHGGNRAGANGCSDGR